MAAPNPTNNTKYLQARDAGRAHREEISRRTKPMHLGKPLISSLDNIAEVLAAAEGENFR